MGCCGSEFMSPSLAVRLVGHGSLKHFTRCSWKGEDVGCRPITQRGKTCLGVASADIPQRAAGLAALAVLPGLATAPLPLPPVPPLRLARLTAWSRRLLTHLLARAWYP